MRHRGLSDGGADLVGADGLSVETFTLVAVVGPGDTLQTGVCETRDTTERLPSWVTQKCSTMNVVHISFYWWANKMKPISEFLSESEHSH